MPCLIVCQDSVLVSRTLLEKVAFKLDSFDVFKLKEIEYLEYKKECEDLARAQDYIIIKQDSVIHNNNNQLFIWEKKESEYINGLKANTAYIESLERQHRKAQVRNKIYLIGGGVVAAMLTAGLIAALTR